MSRVAKKADFITISIYSVLAAAVMYISAALGACVDLAANDEGKVDFDVLTGSLDSTMTDTKLVLSQVQAGGNAMKFPIFAAFGNYRQETLSPKRRGTRQRSVGKSEGDQILTG